MISTTVISCATISKIGSKQESVANTKWTLVDNNFSGAKAPTLVIEERELQEMVVAITIFLMW